MASLCPSCSEPLSKVYTDVVGEPTAGTLSGGTGLSVCASCGQVLSEGFETGGARTKRQTPASETPVSERTARNRVAHFLLDRLLGRGGFGAVWLAEDLNLGRSVALKLPKSLSKDAQLMHEAKTAAKLKHPHIVSVYEVGTEGDQVYIASEFIDGISLREKMSEGRLPVGQVVSLLIVIARAVHHAHEHDVVHRDLKPENIMLDERGEPFVTDFGIAKQISDDETISTDGQIIGTIAYMSPEQARGNTRQTDHRSDVYAIGTMLFEMLTEYRPFRGNARGILHQKLYEDAPSPRKLVPLLPKDLETVCLKCLEREPGKRYQSSDDLADELERFEKGIPIHARPVSRTEMLLRWCKRNQVVAGLAIGVFFSLSIGLLGISYFWRQSESNSRQRQQSLYRTTMVLASNLWNRGDVSGVRRLLERFDVAGQPDQRQFEWFYLDQTLEPFEQIVNHGDAVIDVALSRDGTMFASAGRDRVIRVWDSNSGELIRALKNDTIRIRSLAFSPTQDRLLSTHFDGRARLWNPRQHAKVAAEFAHGNGLIAAKFHPDGKSIVTADQTGTLKWWDCQSPTQLGERTGVAKQLRDIDYSPSGSHLAVASLGGAVVVLDPNRETVAEIESKVRLGRIDFADEETVLLGGGSDRLGVIRWRDETVSDVVSFDGAAVGDVDYFRSNGRIATVLANNNLLVLDADRQPMRELPTHALTHGVLDKSGDEKRLVIGSGDGTVKLIDSESLSVPEVLWHSTHVRGVRFLPDGKQVVTCAGDGAVHRWNIENGEHAVLIEPSGRESLALEIGGDSQLFVVGMSPQVDVIQLDQERSDTIPLAISGFGSISLSPDQRRIAMGNRFGSMMLLDLDQPSETPRQFNRPDLQVNGVQFSPGGKTIAIAYSNGTVVFADASSLESRHEVKLDSSPHSIRYSPSGDLLAVGTQAGEIGCIDTETFEVRMLDAHLGRINALAFFPDGKRLASGGRDRTINLWDVASGECVGILFGHDRQVFGLDVSPDGDCIASVSLQGDLRLWRGAARSVSK